jgi:hypothetical protein
MMIRFIGHMCHYTTATSACAVMFAVPDHVVKVRIQEKYTNLNTRDPEWVHCWEASRSVVRFSSTGATATAHDLTGLLPVPGLSVLGGAGGNVHADVVTPNPRGDFNAFVELPFGDYGIEDWYLHKATFNGGKSFICVPRTITFSAPSTSDWHITGIANPPTLTHDAVVTITNLELKTTTAAHYQFHGRLFDPPISPANPVVPSTNPSVCGDGTRDGYVPQCGDDGQQDLSVECSNTRYP